MAEHQLADMGALMGERPRGAAEPRRQGGEEGVRIIGIAAGGAGVGRLEDGRVAFVQRTAPGDLVDIALQEQKPRWVRGRLLRVQEAGEDRREAPCPHYAGCGGCTLEHLTPAAQLRARGSIVREALRRIGGIDVNEPDVVASPLEFRYRNRVSLTLRRPGGGRVSAGFHELDRPDRVLDIDERCQLMEPLLADAWRSLRAGWGAHASRLPAGETLRLTLRATHTGEVSLLAENGYGDGQPDALLAHVPQIVSLWKRAPEHVPELVAGRAALLEQWNGETVQLGGSVFLQVNRQAAALLENHVLALCGSVQGQRVVDAYCGVGLYARRCQRQGAHITGIELDPLAAREARRGCSPQAQIIEGRVEEHITACLPADLVILNPPRAGLDARVCTALVATPPARVLYVSCDPATLARDLGRLKSAFTLTVAALLRSLPADCPCGNRGGAGMRYYVTLGSRTCEVDLRGALPVVDGRAVHAEMQRVAGTPLHHLLADGQSFPLVLRPAGGRGQWDVYFDGRHYTVEVLDERTRAIREMTGRSSTARGPRPVRAPMPGLVVRIEVEAGQTVRAGQGVVIVEAMKMENELKAETSGIVSRVLVSPGQAVEKGTVLVELQAE